MPPLVSMLMLPKRQKRLLHDFVSRINHNAITIKLAILQFQMAILNNLLIINRTMPCCSWQTSFVRASRRASHITTLPCLAWRSSSRPSRAPRPRSPASTSSLPGCQRSWALIASSPRSKPYRQKPRQVGSKNLVFYWSQVYHFKGQNIAEVVAQW